MNQITNAQKRQQQLASSTPRTLIAIGNDGEDKPARVELWPLRSGKLGVRLNGSVLGFVDDELAATELLRQHSVVIQGGKS